MGTCESWAVEADICAPCDTYAFNPVALENGLAWASEVLSNLTGNRWTGRCTDTVRPPSDCGCAGRDRWWPVAGLPVPLGLCGCGCDGVSKIRLPAYPVVTVDEVIIDGVIVDPARYRVDDRSLLIFQPDPDGTGRRSWPCCQALERAAGEEGTWTVEYTHGHLPPPGGVAAAAMYGCQLALACDPTAGGDAECQLPQRVTTITRQGVSMAILDPMTFVADGLTGLAAVDQWVASVLKADSRRRASAWVPGRRRDPSRTT